MHTVCQDEASSKSPRNLITREIKTNAGTQKNQDHWRQFIREEFAKNKNIPKKKFGTIEHLIRAGHKRYEMYSSDAITDVH
ncbi:unnamed protein product [Kuraishia capsulata CBS 1993]|uniref:Complex 1 LYR protein domain-containing protein n=1 Tax=Kuraishia capsulata CBS 1993 TaxID=1382522 RepID=W6MR13_9ASCO|nr:uncharacterized protein KUCA_T00004773001 [Kuraishia capsulata CBS 1993]CDK28788.1 unnamed protein product [Kuraishia capsulata CBS 1993]